MTPDLLRALDVLARFIVYDFAVVDRRALQSLEIDDVLSPKFIRTTEVPQEIYDEIADQIECMLRDNQGSEDSSPMWRSFIDNPKWQREWFEHADKDYHDQSGLAFGNSTDSLPRALFYLELSRQAGVAAFVSETKREILQFLDKHLSEAFQEIERRVDSSMHKAVTEALGCACQSFDIRMPPLVESIWRKAYKENLSLLESTEALHESVEARGFREWLAGVEGDLRSGSRAGAVNAAKRVNELSSQVKQWTESLNTNLGTTYRERTANLEAIPYIGWIFKLFGVEKVKIKDPYLTAPARYIAFIGNWYKDV